MDTEKQREHKRKYRNSPRGKAKASERQRSEKKRNADRERYLKSKATKASKRRSQRKIYQKQREIILEHYGKVCALCGFADQRALSIDHIEGGGNKHRKTIRSSSGSPFYSWLIKNGFPVGFRTLCMNCQFIQYHENRKKQNNQKKTVVEEQLMLFEIVND